MTEQPSRSISISSDLLLVLCRTGARFIDTNYEAVCVQGVSNEATVTHVELLPNRVIRVHFDDPNTTGAQPALWQQVIP